MVEPQGTTWSPSEFHPFEVTEAGTTPMVVELLRSVQQEFRVQRSDGSPVAGTRVQLLRNIGKQPVDLQTKAVTMERFMNSMHAPRALLLDEGESDAGGTLTLRGPGEEWLAVRVLGPGHQPVVVDDLVLGETDEAIVIQVPGGAAVTARLGPTAVLEALGPLPETRQNRPTDPEWAAKLEPGWQQARIDNFSTLISGTPVDEDLVSDGWTDIIRNLSAMSDRSDMAESPEAVIKAIAEARELDGIHQAAGTHRP